MQLIIANLKGPAAAKEIIIVTHVVEGAGVTRHVGTTGTVVQMFSAAVS